MDFLSGILMAIGGWFGFGSSEVVEMPPEPAAIEQEMVVDDMQNQADSIVVQDIDVDIATNEAAAETQAESEITPELNEINSMTDTNDQMNPTQDIRTAMVAGGCFWCVEADLEKTPGVIEVVSGYAGGSTENPTYETYKKAGHREVVEVTYDASQISYEDILIVTMKTTDPTDDTGTFADRGDGYSAAFYYETADEKQQIDNLIAEVNDNGPYDAPLAIDIEQRPVFWPAEDYHQDYYKGPLSKIRYQYYRNASGRSDFIEKYWGENVGPELPWRTEQVTAAAPATGNTYPWSNYQKPDIETLRATMDATAFRVTQEDGTERAGTSPLDKIYEPGIYVDVLSGEPLFSSRDKFDSRTGWPSFVAPITETALTEHEDRKLFSVRTETRSAIADNHIGHVFNDGPADRGGLRYCMNGAALRFVPEADMVAEGYGDFIASL